jgi:hypothetical protein
MAAAAVSKDASGDAEISSLLFMIDSTFFLRIRIIVYCPTNKLLNFCHPCGGMSPV